jgi:peptidoglycan/LPS O-acetylase OafA/YrhL
MPSSRHIRSLQAARGLAAILVVICHAAAFVGEEPSLWHRYAVYVWLRGTALGVQPFFVLSGIVLYTAHREDIRQRRNGMVFYWKRFRRIYPLYWIFLLPTLRKHSALAVGKLAYMGDPWVVASSVLLVHLFSWRSIMVVSWTLFDEILFYLLFSVLLFNKRIGATLLLIWFSASLFFLNPAEMYWSTIFSPNHLLFGMGVAVAWALEHEWRVRPRLLFWLGLLTYVACIVVDGLWSRGIAVRLAAGLGATGILYGAAVLERDGKWKIAGWLTFLGDASYSIYLAHFMVVSAVARFCYAHWGRLPVPVAGWMALLIGCGVAAGIGVHLAIERPLLALLGQRKRQQRSEVNALRHGWLYRKLTAESRTEA